MILDKFISNFIDSHKMPVEFITRKILISQRMVYPNLCWKFRVNIFNFYVISQMFIMLSLSKIII
jgi:hypothetical protein